MGRREPRRDRIISRQDGEGWGARGTRGVAGVARVYRGKRWPPRACLPTLLRVRQPDDPTTRPDRACGFHPEEDLRYSRARRPALVGTWVYAVAGRLSSRPKGSTNGMGCWGWEEAEARRARPRKQTHTQRESVYIPEEWWAVYSVGWPCSTSAAARWRRGLGKRSALAPRRVVDGQTGSPPQAGRMEGWQGKVEPSWLFSPGDVTRRCNSSRLSLSALVVAAVEGSEKSQSSMGRRPRPRTTSWPCHSVSIRLGVCCAVPVVFWPWILPSAVARNPGNGPRHTYTHT